MMRNDRFGIPAGDPIDTRVRIFCIAAACLLLMSCVDVRLDIRLADDGSGTAELEYSVSRLVEYVGYGESGAPLVVLPTNEAEFIEIIDGLVGIQVENLESEEDSEVFNLSCEIAFSDTNAFERAYSVFCNRQVDIDFGAGEMNMDTDYLSGDEELSDTIPDGLRIYYEEFRIHFELRSFRGIRTSIPGRVEDEAAILSIPVMDIAVGAAPSSWRVEW